MLDDFKKAAQEGKPYTEIISTQAMGLPALCDAVIEYNQWSRVQHPAFTPLVIHQYFTDLPTHGAVHFFNPLSRLSKKQQQQMHLYGLGMSEDVIRTFFPKGEDFGGIYDIPPKDNPMVRPGFTDPDLDYSKFFHKSCKFYLLDSDNEKQDYRITADEQIATILLGSQASNDTVKYIETLLKNGYQKIFVLGGHLFEKEIQEIESRYPQLPNRIVRVSSNQTDTTLTPLLTRSNIIIQRGGGVSVMEAMAMPHNPEQAILIHHTDAHADEIKEKELTSGISWEDCNVDRLVTALSQKGLRTKKTSPELAKSEIPRARLSAALVLLDKSFKTKLAAIQSKSFSHNSSLKRQLMKEASALQKGIKLAASFRQRLSFFNRFILEDFVALLSHPLIKEEPQRLLPLMSAYESCTTQQSSANWEIVLNSLLSENRLTSSWLTKLSHPEANEPFLSREVHRCIILRMMELKRVYLRMNDRLQPVFLLISMSGQQKMILRA